MEKQNDEYTHDGKTYINLKFKAHEFNTLGDYRFADIVSIYDDKWVFCKHKERNTWETQGGHIETWETPLEAAKRELFEETGAISFDIEPLCDYWASGLYKGEHITAHGQAYYAVIHELGDIPGDSEMEEICFFDEISDDVTTYPDYMKEIFPIAVKKRKRSGDKSGNKI